MSSLKVFIASLGFSGSFEGLPVGIVSKYSGHAFRIFAALFLKFVAALVIFALAGLLRAD